MDHVLTFTASQQDCIGVPHRQILINNQVYKPMSGLSSFTKTESTAVKHKTAFDDATNDQLQHTAIIVEATTAIKTLHRTGHTAAGVHCRRVQGLSVQWLR